MALRAMAGDSPRTWLRGARLLVAPGLIVTTL
jgi:hypothetical protein